MFACLRFRIHSRIAVANASTFRSFSRCCVLLQGRSAQAASRFCHLVEGRCLRHRRPLRKSRNCAQLLELELAIARKASLFDCTAMLSHTNCTALESESGDVEKAKEWLRKKGVLKSATRADRVASMGFIGLATAGHSRAAIVEVCIVVQKSPRAHASLTAGEQRD